MFNFRPIDIEVKIKKFIEQEFQPQFIKNFDQKSNLKFLSKIRDLVHSKQFKVLLQTVIHVAQNGVGEKWQQIGKMAENLLNSSGNVFDYVEGILTEAAKNGDWILLDEVNLAEEEVLIALNSICNNLVVPLQDGKKSLVKVHPDFR